MEILWQDEELEELELEAYGSETQVAVGKTVGMAIQKAVQRAVLMAVRLS